MNLSIAVEPQCGRPDLAVDFLGGVQKHDRICGPTDNFILMKLGQLVETGRVRDNIHESVPGDEGLFQPRPMASIWRHRPPQSKTRVKRRLQHQDLVTKVSVARDHFQGSGRWIRNCIDRRGCIGLC
jgi:hypothetical protein